MKYVLYSDATRSGMHACKPPTLFFFFFLLFLIMENLRTYCHPAGPSSATNSEFWDRDHLWSLYVGLWANLWTDVDFSLPPFLVFDWYVRALLSIDRQ